MRALALLALLLAPLPAAGGASFVEVEAPAAACGEGCLRVEPGAWVRVEPAPARVVVWQAEDERGLPLAAGALAGEEWLEMPPGAARLVVRAL